MIFGHFGEANISAVAAGLSGVIVGVGLLLGRHAFERMIVSGWSRAGSNGRTVGRVPHKQRYIVAVSIFFIGIGVGMLLLGLLTHLEMMKPSE